MPHCGIFFLTPVIRDVTYKSHLYPHTYSTYLLNAGDLLSNMSWIRNKSPLFFQHSTSILFQNLKKKLNPGKKQAGETSVKIKARKTDSMTAEEH